MKRFNCLVLSMSTLAFGLHAQTLRVNPGTQVIVTGYPAIVFNHVSLINNGHFTGGNSTMLFTGGTNAYIGGSNPVSFYKLVVNLPNGELELAGNAIVMGGLILDSGNLQLNNHCLHLAGTAFILGERNDARIVAGDGGIVTITVPLNSPHAVNPGNIGVEITTEADLGPTTITRGHTIQSNTPGQTGIQRWFEIAPSRNTGAAASLRLFYFEAELNGNNKKQLSLFATLPGVQSWTDEGKDYSDPGGHWLLKSIVQPFRRFTLAPELPSNPHGASAYVYPNPSRNSFTLAVSSAQEKEGIIRLYDQWGRIMQTRAIHCVPGVNTIKWDISRYAAGAYRLVFENLDISSTQVLKQ